jgi:hypothetical protein
MELFMTENMKKGWKIMARKMLFDWIMNEITLRTSSAPWWGTSTWNKPVELDKITLKAMQEHMIKYKALLDSELVYRSKSKKSRSSALKGMVSQHLIPGILEISGKLLYPLTTTHYDQGHALWSEITVTPFIADELKMLQNNDSMLWKMIYEQ